MGYHDESTLRQFEQRKAVDLGVGMLGAILAGADITSKAGKGKGHLPKAPEKPGVKTTKPGSVLRGDISSHYQL